MASEPLSVNLCYIVIRGTDAGRSGRAVDVLEMSEVIGGWWETLCAWCHGRPPRHWTMPWIVLEFDEGDQGAFRLDELEARNG